MIIVVLIINNPSLSRADDAAAVAPGGSFVNGLGMIFVRVPAGSFVMGPGPAHLGGAPEGPGPRKIEMRKPFYLGATEVTQERWSAVMGSNPSYRRRSGHPVENVSYLDVLEFARRLNLSEGGGYRLPTEAEWEYAARAGSETNYFFGDSPEDLPKYAWYDENIASGGHHPAAGKSANPFGLFDVYGNVYEWTMDPYPDPARDLGAKDGAPADERDGSGLMVIKGGCYANAAEDVQSASRFMELSRTRSMLVGFRLVFQKE
ncbi:MAG: formylglycine-generating enzyme family protein [Deltaproteobacteria bacterium]|nr:formylglycine-generating enzyme family protein [Deltaproteobacteria bacterium]